MSASVITLKPTTDVLDIEKKSIINIPYVDVEPGRCYRLDYVSTVKYNNGNLPMNKVVVYNTTDEQPLGWFYVVEAGIPQIIQIGERGTWNRRLYAFLVDITSGDNTGEGKLTVTQLP